MIPFRVGSFASFIELVGYAIGSVLDKPIALYL